MKKKKIVLSKKASVREKTISFKQKEINQQKKKRGTEVGKPGQPSVVLKTITLKCLIKKKMKH